MKLHRRHLEHVTSNLTYYLNSVQQTSNKTKHIICLLTVMSLSRFIEVFRVSIRRVGQQCSSEFLVIS